MKKTKNKKNLLLYGGIGVLLLLLVGAVTYYLTVLRFQRVSYYGSEYDEEVAIEESCNVIGVNLHGEIFTYVPYENEDGDYASSENILSYLQENTYMIKK